MCTGTQRKAYILNLDEFEQDVCIEGTVDTHKSTLSNVKAFKRKFHSVAALISHHCRCA